MYVFIGCEDLVFIYVVRFLKYMILYKIGENFKMDELGIVIK